MAWLFAVLGILGSTYAYIRYWPTRVVVMEFKAIVLEGRKHAYSSWYLYKITDDDYYLEYSFPIVPRRFVVSRDDIVIRNGSNGEAIHGYVYMDQYLIKAKPEISRVEEVF